jgi:hypothetical protein
MAMTIEPLAVPAPPEAATVGVVLGTTWAAPGDAETASAPITTATAKSVTNTLLAADAAPSPPIDLANDASRVKPTALPQFEVRRR